MEESMLLNKKEYIEILNTIKNKIRKAQIKTLVNANKEMLTLYWNIGNMINHRSSWGNKFVENLSRDIRLEFPSATGYSVRNMKYMAKFARIWEKAEIVQRALHNLPWRHNIVLLERLKSEAERLWYAEKTTENGWSRDILVHQIDTGLYQREVKVKKISNFARRLPTPQRELVSQTMKDPYIFDFFSGKEKMIERDIENELVKNITQFLLELGSGFAFVGNQYHLEISGRDFYIDLLFYHLKLRCYIVIELKTGEFEPEYAGKLNFYLSAVDDTLRNKNDNPSIGILLCRTKDNLIAEYALRDVSKPIGISEYKIIKRLPKELKNELPSADDLKNRIITNGQQKPPTAASQRQG
jgi:predicted nuclease of restriction endonuclease-like (RecB) superfamily